MQLYTDCPYTDSSKRFAVYNPYDTTATIRAVTPTVQTRLRFKKYDLEIIPQDPSTFHRLRWRLDDSIIRKRGLSELITQALSQGYKRSDHTES